MADVVIDPDALVYCQVADIADALNITIDATSTPKEDYVKKLIRRKQDEIDRRTRHAWRPRKVTDELHDLEGEFEISRGHQIGLHHRLIKTVDSAQGDKIAYWNGNSYQNLLSGTTVPDGINILYDRGIMEFKTYSWFYGTSIYRYSFNYRYGEASVPKDIEDACVKLVLLDLVNASLFMEQLPYGGDRDSIANTLKKWREDVDETIANYVEVVAIH